MATLPCKKERWLVQTFGGVKGTQLCCQNPVFPPLKGPKTGFPSINGGNRFNGFPIDNPSSITIPQCQPKRNSPQVSHPQPSIAINLYQHPFLGTAINPGLQHGRQAQIVGPANNPSPLPSFAAAMVMPTVQGGPAPILGLVNPRPLPSPAMHTILPTVQEILKTQPLNSQVKSEPDSLPPPPLHLGGAAIAELLNSLAKQGLIKPTEKTQIQSEPAPIGLEFDPALLKKRHESVIDALYSDLPRQCSTCGVRFKSSGEHSRHMDWHVRKNRAKQQKLLSLKWFPTSDEEASPAIPESWLCPKEILDGKKAEELLVVRADYGQKLCALCNENSEDFYCDSTEDWMYRGAVYMNASNEGLGPIVHAKCLPKPSV